MIAPNVTDGPLCRCRIRARHPPDARCHLLIGLALSSDSTQPAQFRRNATGLVLGRVAASVGIHFAGVSSVVPAFARHLTSSAPLIGLIGTAYYAGLLLPEALLARLIAPWPRKKPFASVAHVGRLMFFVIALALWAGLASDPPRMLTQFIVCLALWAVGEGAGTVGRLDIVGRTLPRAPVLECTDFCTRPAQSPG